MTWKYIDVVDPQAVGIIRALVRYIDASLGYPRVSSMPDGSRADPKFDILHHTLPIPHPTESGRWMLPVDEEAVGVLHDLRAGMQAMVTAGVTSGAGASLVAAYPVVILDELDASWSQPPPDLTGRPWDAGPDLLPEDKYPQGLV